MQVKVIKAINGLEEGDILNYNEKTHKYEIKKIEEDISDRGYSCKKTMHTYSKNTIIDHPEYFVFINEFGDVIGVVEDIKEDTETLIKNLLKSNSELQAKVIRLENEIESQKGMITNYKDAFYTPNLIEWNAPYKSNEVYYGMQPVSFNQI